MSAVSEAAAFVERLPSPALAVDAAGRILAANRAMAGCLACGPADLVGSDLAFWAADPATIADFLSGPVEGTREFRFRAADGSPRYLALAIARDALPCGHAVSAFDITKQVLAEQAMQDIAAKLRRSEEHLKKAQRIAEIGSVEHDLATGNAVWSDEVYRIIGAEPGTLAPTLANYLNLVHEEDRPRLMAAMTQTGATGRPVVSREGQRLSIAEYRIVRLDGQIRVIHPEWDILRDASGKATHLFITLRDVTELRAAELRQKETEQQLQEAQKLEALGTLAGGVAHELNNTLVPVLALAKITMKRLPEGSREQANLQTIMSAAEKARDMVERIVAFARKEMPTRIAVDIVALTQHALALLRESLPASVRLEPRIEPVPPVLGDPTRLPQIIINLVVNAVQAMPDQTGTITVEVARAPGERLPQMPDRVAGGAIRLSVIDRGIGMDKATRARVFEPFFTTRGVGEGSGLGLSVVHGIVTQHGGHITVESEIGRGTRFDVYLPAAEAAAPARAALQPAS